MISISLLNAQDISFSADSVINSGYTGVAITCADFNQDEYSDIAVALSNEAIFDPVSIYLNDGSGNIFETADSSYKNTDSPKGIACGDLNNDQITDLAITIYDDSTLVILLGNGDGSFTKGDDIKLPTKPGELLITDFDNDQNSDIAVVSRYGMLMTFSGDGSGSFSEPALRTGIGTAHDIDAHDMNKDGFVDLIVGTGNVYAVELFMNDGQGNYDSRKNISTYRPSWYVKAGDFNNDGYPDIAAGSGSWDFNNVYLLMGNEAGEYSCPDTLSPGTYVNDISTADYNGDNNLDLLVADRNGFYILSGKGDGHFSRIDTIAYEPSAYQAKSVESVDINNDGLLDVVIARDSKISIYYNNTALTSIYESYKNPFEFTLFQNYPNPFNPQTNITYQIDNPGKVTLTLFNNLGQKITTLVNENQAAGQYSNVFDGNGLASGIYIYKLSFNNVMQSRKMFLIK